MKGLLKFITDQRKDPVFNFIADHFDLRYYNSDYLIGNYSETTFKGIELVLSNFNFN